MGSVSDHAAVKNRGRRRSTGWIAGINTGIPVTGLDLINLPTNGVAGTNLVTNVIGARWKPSGHVEMGFGREYP